MNRAVFADDVVVSDFHSCFPFGRERKILGRRANNRAVTYKIAIADHDLAFDHDV